MPGNASCSPTSGSASSKALIRAMRMTTAVFNSPFHRPTQQVIRRMRGPEEGTQQAERPQDDAHMNSWYTQNHDEASFATIIYSGRSALDIENNMDWYGVGYQGPER